MIRSFLSLLILVFLSAPVMAADINDAGAKRLKAQFTALLEKQKKAIESTGGTLGMDGDITVEQASNYYALTLPALTTKDANGNVHKIGLIAINATPTNTPNNWKMSVALPTPILSFDKNDTPLTRLDIGSQRMGGIWNGELNNFSKIAASYNDLKFSDYRKKQSVSAQQIDITSDLKQSANKTWTGPFQLALSNLKIAGMNATNTQNKNLATIKDIKIKTIVDGFAPEKQRQILENAQNQDPQSMTMNILENIGNSFSIQATLNGLNVSTTAASKKPTTQYTLANAVLDFKMNGLKDKLISQDIKLNYNGFSNPNSSDPFKEIFPEKLNIDLKLKNLPLLDLMSVANNAFPSSGDGNAARQVAALQAMMTLPQILSKASTTLTLANSTMGNALYTANFDGSLNANPASIIGATGVLNTTVTGLDDTIKFLEGKIKDEKDVGRKEKLNDTLKRLNAFKGVSKNEGNKSICNVTLNEQAKISINGQDVSGLLDLLAQ